MSNVVYLDILTQGEIPGQRIVDAMKDFTFEGVIIVGIEPDGTENYFSSYGEPEKSLWLLERMKKMLLED